MNKSWPILGALVALGGFVVNVLRIDEKLIADWPAFAPLVGPLEVSLLTISLAILIFGGSQIVSFGLNFFQGKRQKFADFISVQMSSEDLSAALELFHSINPDSVSIDTYRRIFVRSPLGWIKFMRAGSSRLIGYFIVLPLSKRGEEAILERRFFFGDSDSEKYFLKGFKDSRAGYVAMVCADKSIHNADAFALQEAAWFVNRKYRFSRVYAKAATRDGLRLLKKREFRPAVSTDAPDIGTVFVKTIEMIEANRKSL